MTVWMNISAMVCEGLKKQQTHPPVAQTWGGWGSTCGILYHSHHRTGAGPGKKKKHTWGGELCETAAAAPPVVNSRHSPRFRTCCSTCTQCTASGTSSPPPSWWAWTADRTGGLRAQTGSIQRYEDLQSFYFVLGVGDNAPERPQSEQDTSSSDWPVLWLVLESPKQKSQ